jgi:hypothetical protein
MPCERRIVNRLEPRADSVIDEAAFRRRFEQWVRAA